MYIFQKKLNLYSFPTNLFIIQKLLINFYRFIPFLLILFPFVTLSLWYVKRTLVDVVVLDGFINIQLIGRILSGDQIALGEIFSAWYEEHFNLGYRLYNIVNARLFNLDMRIDPILFIFAYSFTAFLIYLNILEIFPQKSNLEVSLFFLPMAFLCFTLVAPPLLFMTTQFVWGVAIGLLIAFMIQKICSIDTQKLNTNLKMSVYTLALVPVYFLLFSGGYFLGLFTGVFGMYLVIALVTRNWIHKKIFLVLGTVVLCGAVYYYFGFLRQFNNQVKAVNGLWHYFSDFGNTILFYIAGFGGSLMDLHTAESNPQTLLWIGSILTIISFFAIFHYFQTKMYQKTLLPIYCVFYSIGVITSVRLGRGLYGDWTWITNEWYSFQLRFFVIGVVWILLLSIWTLDKKERGSNPPRNRWSHLAGIAVALIFIFSCHFYSNWAQWQRSPHVYDWLKMKRSALLSPEKYPNYAEILLWPKEKIDQDLAILKKYSLSSFATRQKISFWK